VEQLCFQLLGEFDKILMFGTLRDKDETISFWHQKV